MSVSICCRVTYCHVQLPADKSSRYFHSMQYKLARDEHARVLNPYQSAYLLLDNGLESCEDPVKAVDCVQKFRKKFDQCLAEMETLGNGTNDIGILEPEIFSGVSFFLKYTAQNVELNHKCTALFSQSPKQVCRSHGSRPAASVPNSSLRNNVRVRPRKNMRTYHFCNNSLMSLHGICFIADCGHKKLING